MSKLSNIERLCDEIYVDDIFEQMAEECPGRYFTELDGCRYTSPTDLDCLRCWTQVPDTYVKRKEHGNGFVIRCLDCDSDDVNLADGYSFDCICNSCGQA